MRRSVGDSAGDASQPGASPAPFYLLAEDGGFDYRRGIARPALVRHS